MHCEYLVVDNRRDGKAVEAVNERAPDLDVVPAFTYREPQSMRRVGEKDTYIRRRSHRYD